MIKIIKVGLASFGMSGLIFHGPLLKENEGFIVRKVLERTKRLSEEMFPDSEIVRDYTQILEDPEIDLVVVNTPDKLHYSMTKQALEARKHVVVEKPFTISVEEGKELIELSKRNDRILTVFQNRRWDSDFLTVQKIVNEGWLGRIVEFEIHFDRYKDSIQENTWKEDPETGTDVLYNLGSHLIDQALVLFGFPQSVFADLKKVRKGSRVVDYFHIHMYYADFKAILKCSYQVREPGPKFMVHGSNGSFIKYGIDPQEEDLKNGKMPGSKNWGEEPQEYNGKLNTLSPKKKFNGILPGLPGNYPLFYQNLYNSIIYDDALAVKPEEALDVIRIIEAAQKSNIDKNNLTVKIIL